MKKFTSGFILLLILSFSVSPFSISPAQVTESTWATKASMPTAISGLGVAVVNGKIYAIGHNLTYEYDPATDTWATKTSMPTPRRSFATAVYQNKIYIIGGSIGFDWAKGESILCSFNEVYDPLTDTWETKTSMPTNRSQLNANVVNGKIHLIGGRTGGSYTTVSLNEVYDPSTDTWTTKKPIPYPVVQYASAVVDNKIYVIGGQDEFHPDCNVAFNQIYDPESDTWSQRASLLSVVWQTAAGATTGVLAPKRIYVIGGLPDKGLEGTNINQVYNPENDTWTFGASMPTPRFGLAVAVVNDVLYALGGMWMALNPQSPIYAVNEQYTPFGFGTIPPDTMPPPISIVSPENKTYTVNNVSLTFTVSEPTSWIRYSLDGQANVTITDNTILTGLSEGTHHLTVYAKDIAGNTGASKTIIFRVTKPFPTWIVAVIGIIVVVGAALLVYFAKVKKTTGKIEK